MRVQVAFVVAFVSAMRCQMVSADPNWGACQTSCLIANARTRLTLQGTIRFEPVEESTTRQFLSLQLGNSTCFSVRPRGVRTAECITLDRVHVVLVSPRSREADLRAALGHRVAVRGVATEALSPNHHTPIVLLVSSFQVLP